VGILTVHPITGRQSPTGAFALYAGASRRGSHSRADWTSGSVTRSRLARWTSNSQHSSGIWHRRAFSAYPTETIIAEKAEAMVDLGISNSRMKDFSDIASPPGA
jgi:hypothetical protein